MIDLLPIFAISFIGIFLNVWFFLVTLEKLSLHTKTRIPRRFPKISVLIPAHNEAASISKTLHSVFNLNYPRKKLEVIVIDNASTDDTYKIAKKVSKRFSWAKVFKIKQKGKALALERGFKTSSGEIVGILDADTVVSRNVLKKMVGHFDDPQIGAVTNLIRVDSKRNLISRFQHLEYIVSALAKKLLSILDSLYITPGTLSLVRRDAIKKIGFSSDTLTEDMDLALSLIKKDYKIFHCLDAQVKTTIPKSWKDWVMQRIRWYRGYIENMVKHKDLIFNKKHVMLGWFVLPISGFLSIFIGIYTTLYTTLYLLGDYSYNIFLRLQNFSYFSTTDYLNLFFQSFSRITELVYNPYALLLFTFVFFTSMFVIILSTRIVKGASKADLLLLPVYMLVYYTLVMVNWFVSLILEALKRNKKW